MTYNQPGPSSPNGQQNNTQSHATFQQPGVAYNPQKNAQQYLQSNPPQSYHNPTYQQGTIYQPQSSHQAYHQPGYHSQQDPSNPNLQSSPPQQQMGYNTPTQQPAHVSLSPEEEHELQVLRKYAHVARLPMFCLYEPSDAEGMRKDEELRQEVLNSISPSPQLSISQKVMLKGLGAATGADFFNTDKTVNGVLKFGVSVLAMGTSENMMSILSRWASPPDARCHPIVVDVLQSCRLSSGPEPGSLMYFKTNRDGKFLVNGKYDKKCKREKCWYTSIKPGLASIAFVDEQKVEHKLERVLCISRPISIVEGSSQQPRFRKKWNVPG